MLFRSKNVLRISRKQVAQARRQVLSIYLSDPMEEYIVQLVLATRNPSAYNSELEGWVEYGASPRGSISLERTSRAHAWLNGRDYVSPDDVQKVIHDVLRHRIILSFNAEAEGRSEEHTSELQSH